MCRFECECVLIRQRTRKQAIKLSTHQHTGHRQKKHTHTQKTHVAPASPLSPLPSMPRFFHFSQQCAVFFRVAAQSPHVETEDWTDPLRA